MKPTITLFHYWRSSCSWRVRWALELKGLDYQSVAVNLLNSEQRNADYLIMNPSGLVPTLKVGDRFLSESLPIIEWLEETYPIAPLLPKDPWDKALVRELCMMVASGIQPVQNLKVARFYSADQEKRDDWNRHFIEEGFRAIEQKLANLDKRPYCFGQDLTMADIVLVPQVYNALRVHVQMHSFPRIAAVYTHCLKTEACERSAPQQPAL